MATEHWYRWHHGTVTDPKWKVVAMRAGNSLSRKVTIGHVVSVWAAMMERASQSTPRGELSGWVDEDIAAALDIDESEVAAIREAMQGKTLDGQVLIAWKRRQPKAEDVTAADRKRAQRERDADDKARRGHAGQDVMSRDVTDGHDRGEERRVEEEKTLSSGDDGDQSEVEKGGDQVSRLIPVKVILAAYRTHLPMLPDVRVMTDARRRKLKARWTEDAERQDVSWWDEYFAFVAKSDFLTGRDARWTGCDFEWLIEAGNLVKVIEGKYENRSVA